MDALATVITAVLAVVSPLAIALAKRESWSTLAKVAAPILVSIVLGWGYVAYTGGLRDPSDLVQAILTVYGAQQLAYTTIMRWWATVLEQVGNKPGAVLEDGPEHRAE